MAFTINRCLLVPIALCAFVTMGTGSANASSGHLTMKRLKSVVATAANNIEDSWESDDGTVIIDWSGSCRLISAFRGRCNIDYEFDDGVVCTDTVRARKKSKRSNMVYYWSDSQKTDDGGDDDSFDDCTD